MQGQAILNPMKEIELERTDGELPADVARLIADAERRIEEFDRANPGAPIPAFVASDFEQVYRALAQIVTHRLAAGHQFLEWGSGLGAVTCLADRLGFHAVGIEIEAPLVKIAEALAEEHEIDAEFLCGSFLPSGDEAVADTISSGMGDVAWLRTDGPDAYAVLELDPDDFDLIFAYPWPGEEQVLFDLFEENAAVGALLLTYHGQEGIRLQRKTGRGQ